MKGSDYLKEHRELIGLLGNTSKALRNEALTQTKELTKELMKNPTRKNALALAKRGSSNLGKRMTTRGNRLVLRKGNVMGNGLFGDLFEDAIVEGGKKLYQFDKSHGSHLKEGVKSGFKNMISNVFKGNGIESATRFGRGKGGSSDRPPAIMNEHRRMILEGRGFYPDMAYLDVMPEMIYPAVLPDVSDWVEKERRSTGYYDRPAILGEGM